LCHLARIDRPGGEFVQVATALKALTGHCIANRTPDPVLARRLFCISTLYDDAYTISALKWFRETVEAGRCTSMDLRVVAMHSSC
jgi:hypothetical protein